MILHFYIARRFVTTFLGILAVFGIAIFLVEMVENLRRFGDEGVSVTTLARLTLLTVPGALYRILPLLTVIATITLFINLARSSEMVVARASGRSAMRSLTSPVLASLVLGLFGIAILNPIAAATSREFESMVNRIDRGTDSTLSVNAEGLWLRQGGAEGQTVIRATKANLDGTQLSGVTFLGLDAKGSPKFRIEAEEAELRPGAWVMSGAKVWRFDLHANPEREAEVHETYRLASNLTREEIRDSFGTPSSISFWDLPRFINRLESAGFSASSHRVWYQNQLALPVTMAAMVLIGAAFTLRHTRMGRTGTMVLLATMCGFALYFIRNFSSIMAENGQIPLFLGTWGPPLAAIMLSLALLLHLEDG